MNQGQAKVLQKLREIEEFPEYSVSPCGKVWSHPKRRGSKNGIWLKQSISKSGYHSVYLGKGNRRLVHRLVAQTFIENKENKKCVNHINGNKSDNKINNLEWVTYSENELHSYKVLGKKPNNNNLGKTGLLSNSSMPVRGTCIKTGLEVFFPSTCQASNHGYQQTCISSCARGIRKTHKKMTWEYISKEEYKNAIRIAR